MKVILRLYKFPKITLTLEHINCVLIDYYVTVYLECKLHDLVNRYMILYNVTLCSNDVKVSVTLLALYCFIMLYYNNAFSFYNAVFYNALLAL